MPKAKTLSLFVFVDALGWELVEQYPFLEDVLTTRAPLNTIFGYSSTCDPTFLTGKMPREHGHFAFYFYDPKNSPFRFYRLFNLLPRSLTRRGRVRHLMSRFMKRLHGYTGYFQLYNMPFENLHLFNYSEKKNIFQPGGINNGQPTIFDHLRASGTSYVKASDYTISEGANIEHLVGRMGREEFSFAYLFLGKLDAILHEHGTQGAPVAKHLDCYAAQLRAVIAKGEEHYDEVRCFVFSDHGMTNITDVCDLMGRIEGLGLAFGVDYSAVYDSTMARFWLLRSGAREAIVGALEGETRGHVLSEVEMAEWGCDFADQQYGELFFLMDPGVLICPSFMGDKPLAGMHGFAPEDGGSTASFLSNVVPDSMPKRLDDMYGLMRGEVDG